MPITFSLSDGVGPKVEHYKPMTMSLEVLHKSVSRPRNWGATKDACLSIIAAHMEEDSRRGERVRLPDGGLRKPKKGEKPDVPPTKPLPSNCFILDCDGTDSVQAVEASIKEWGYVLWHTASSGVKDETHDGRARVRVVFELSRPVDSAEYTRFGAAFIKSLGLTDVCLPQKQLMYLPTERSAGLGITYNPGPVVDVDVMLPTQAPVTAPAPVTAEAGRGNHAEIEAALAAIPATEADASGLWLTLLQAVKHGLGDAGYDLFDAWSQGGASYNAEQNRIRWDSVRDEVEGGVTLDTLWYHAEQHGYQRFTAATDEDFLDFDIVEGTSTGDTDLDRVLAHYHREEADSKGAERYRYDNLAKAWNGCAFKDGKYYWFDAKQRMAYCMVKTEFDPVRLFGFSRAKNSQRDEYYDALVAQDAITKEEARAMKQARSRAGYGRLLDELKVRRQFSGTAESVDLFADEATTTLEHGCFKAVYPWVPFKASSSSPRKAAIKSVWLSHYAGWQDYCRHLLMSRFAGSRKNAGVWLHAPSDWGKSLMMAPAKRLGIVADVQMDELKKAAEGAPSGLLPEMFVNAWQVFVEECDRVSGEYRLLDQEITFAPKGKAKVTVPVYGKWLASASGNSMVNGGVDPQFANRVAYWRGDAAGATIEERLREIGATTYEAAEVMAEELAAWLNSEVARMRALGRDVAAAEANRWLDTFRRSHSLTDTFESADDTATELADRLRDKIIEAVEMDTTAEVLGCSVARDTDGTIWTLSPGTIVEGFLTEVFAKTPALAGKMKHQARGGILEKVWGVGQENKASRHGGRVGKWKKLSLP